MPQSEFDKSPSCREREQGREAGDQERKGDRKKRSSLRPLFLIKLIHGHKSRARRPRQGLISQASKTQPWEAMSTKVWFPFVCLWSVLYSATLHWCLPWIGYNKALRKGKEENEEDRRMEWVWEICVQTIYVCVCWCESVCVFVCLLTAGGEILNTLDMHPVSSERLPLCQGRMWTLITQILWHTWKFTSYPCSLTVCQISFSTVSRSLFLVPSLSLFFFFLAVCAVIGRSFVIQQIPSSNLFMVVVDNKCDCSMFEPITMDPIEIMYILHWPKSRGVREGVVTVYMYIQY